MNTVTAKCWRCEGTGITREPCNGYQPEQCSSCEGTTRPERTTPRVLVLREDAGVVPLAFLDTPVTVNVKG